MNKKQELEARMNIETFDGKIARVDSNSVGDWYIHAKLGRPNVEPYTHYLTKAGEWESGSSDRWDSMEEAIAFAKNGPPTQTKPTIEYTTIDVLIESLRKYPQKAVVLGQFGRNTRSELKVASDNDADPTKATTVYIEVVE